MLQDRNKSIKINNWVDLWSVVVHTDYILDGISMNGPESRDLKMTPDLQSP